MKSVKRNVFPCRKFYVTALSHAWMGRDCKAVLLGLGVVQKNNDGEIVPAAGNTWTDLRQDWEQRFGEMTRKSVNELRNYISKRMGNVLISK